ncbi:succinyldiaminopimelate transaminase [Granulicoccus sp. GXG6511]|uniref:succinyldiaminopimelate transaminase n=1 Tax=Granulicoccus sp. GXG6511 TaxID=3381351 RepID=UPI003D7E1B6E
MRKPHTSALPDFPWDTLAGAKQRAGEHPGGMVDLSVGTPVDPVPEVGRSALATATEWPGYPTTLGTPALQDAIAAYLTGRLGVADPGVTAAGDRPVVAVPAIGTKEIVADLPHQLGLGPDDTLVIPEVAYPTYAVGGELARCRVVVCDDPTQAPPATMAWINSPSNPTGAVAAPELLRGWVEWARAHDAILAADECYLEFGWEADPQSILHPDICGGSHDNLLIAHSLSKRSNLAGYRAGFVAGDPALLAELLEVRKHSGFMMPGPMQDVMTALLADQEHVEVQRERYAARRALLRPALERVGFTIHHSEAGLYLWATRGESGRDSVAFLAELGILVAPGDFYGPASGEFVRIAMTATDERVRAGVERLNAVT